MTEQMETRRAMVLGVERFALYARYLVYFVLVPMFLLTTEGGEVIDVVAIGTLILLHNLLVHWVFLTRRYHLFMEWQNLFVYLIEASVIVAVTDADSSDGYLLYIFILIGFSAYVRNFRKTMQVAGLCCVCYGALLAWVWNQGVFEEAIGPITARICGIVITGWMVGILSQLLFTAERQSHRTTQALAASQTTLRTILDSAADAIVVYDVNESIVEANNRASEFFGVPRGKLIGQRFRSFVFDDGTVSDKMAGLRATGEYRGEQVLMNAEDEERTADVRVRSYIQGGQQFFVLVAHDITEQKSLQEATRLANADLERLNRELRQVDQLKTGFLASMSQKLRSPMSAILGYTEMLLEEELGEVAPEQRKALQTCRRSALRVLRLLDDALDLSRPEPPPPTPSPSAESTGIDPAK